MTRYVLTPDGAHAVFRAVLAALARPGTVAQLPPADCPAALLPALALATLDTPVALLGDEPGGRWRERVRLATSAPAADAGRARFVAALRPPTAAELAGVARGSAQAPEDAALVTVGVSDVEGGTPAYELRGPGVDGVARFAPHGWDEDLHRARDEATASFPAGPDLLLVAPDGRVIGLPRTTRATPTPSPAPVAASPRSRPRESASSTRRVRDSGTTSGARPAGGTL
ncbi:MAG: phosphonate C-P lyase system protein PhnH [Pseudonocardia sp.]